MPQVAALEEFAGLLTSEARVAGLIGAREDDQLISRHILEACSIVPLLSGPTGVVDVGSGAGLPGIPITILTRKPIVLIDSRARAAAFLRVVVAKLGLVAQVLQQPAEDAAHTALRNSADAVVARALAPPPVALELTLPFVRPGGSALLLVGPSAREQDSSSAWAARELGGSAPAYRPLEVPGASKGLWVMIVGKVDQTAERYPRRPGVPRRRPLGVPVTGVD